MALIDINLYYGEEPCNEYENQGFPFKDPCMKCYYIQIYHRLKTLNKLKRIIMKELHANPITHDIKITFHSPLEVLPQRINYMHMEIEEDKHGMIDSEREMEMREVVRQIWRRERQ